jgi:hypothetical protein
MVCQTTDIDENPLDEVLQLSNVSGPGVVHQHLENLG